MILQYIVRSLGVLVLLASVSGVAFGAGGEAFTDPAKAGPDFELQGEYKGSVETPDGIKTYGGQIIALGDGKFRIVGYEGGLPGDGWSRGDGQTTMDAKAEDGKITAKTERADLVIGDGEISVQVNGQELGTLKKVERKSDTLGAKPPKGALVLFDGSSADNFRDGKLVEGKWLGATNCESKKKLGDHQLHIEFRTPFMPKSSGQGRGNSGVYMQSRYELQVL
ncbi:MAG: family 16 glycoside hydrolase, partial [Rubripirellula sp.]